MSDYIAPLFCFALVLSPLYIPIGVTVVDWVSNWRATPHAADVAVRTRRRAPEPMATRRTEPA